MCVYLFLEKAVVTAGAVTCMACVGKCGRKDQCLITELAETKWSRAARLRRQSRVEEDSTGEEEWGALGFLLREAPRAKDGGLYLSGLWKEPQLTLGREKHLFGGRQLPVKGWQRPSKEPTRAL